MGRTRTAKTRAIIRIKRKEDNHLFFCFGPFPFPFVKIPKKEKQKKLIETVK
jgi:hypothetical protein